MSTIKDVAKRAGVSVSTVSIILNGKEKERKISQQTVEKVNEAIASLGYIPNSAAKKLRGSGKKTIALFWAADDRGIMLAQFLLGLNQTLEEKKLDHEVIVVPYQNGNLDLERFRSKCADVDGIIFANANQEDLDQIQKNRPPRPFVLYNREIPGICSVCVLNEEIVDLSYSLLKGHVQPILLLTAPNTMEERATLLQKKLPNATIISIKENDPQCAYDACDSICWDLHPVIYTLSDLMAIGILRYCNEKNIKPEILSIGNGLNPFDAFLSPSLSVIQIPLIHLAKICMEKMDDLLNDRFTKSCTVAAQYIERETFKA